MNYGITVKQLAEFCADEIAKGNGNKKVLISSDDEGNDFHVLFYGFTSDKKEIKEINEYTGFLNDEVTADKVVLLG